MLSVLRQPRWVALTLLAVIFVVSFVMLGRWQLSRHEERSALNAILETNATRPPVAADTLLATAVDRADEWRRIAATGTYDAAHQLLVRGQAGNEGSLGYAVLLPLVPADGGPAVLVERGWVPAGADALAAPEVAPPPAGEVTVVGWTRPSTGNDAGAVGLPDGQVRAFALPAIAANLPYAALDGGYLALLAGEPGTGTDGAPPVAVAVPEVSAGPHLGYSVQWFLFALIAIIGWFVLARGAARELAGDRRGMSPSRPPRPLPGLRAPAERR